MDHRADRTSLPRVILVAALLLALGPTLAEEGPCHLGTHVGTLAVDLTGDGRAALSWLPVPGAQRYEVLACAAAAGPCSLTSVAATELALYLDDESESSNHTWYRVVAIVEGQSDGCPLASEYCSLRNYTCGGPGICGPYDEFCWPDYIDPVCGCDGRTFTNACFAGAAGMNVRHRGSCSP